MIYKLLIIFVASSIMITAQVTSINSHTINETNNSDTLRPKYGISLGLSNNLFNADFTALPGIASCCPGYQSGNGTSPYFMISYQFPIDDNLTLGISSGINLIDGLMTTRESKITSLDIGEVEGVFEHSIDVRISEFLISPSINYFFYKNFILNGSFNIGFPISSNFRQKEVIVEPSNRGFFTGSDSSRTRGKFSGDIPDLNSLLFGISTKISYELPLNRNRTLKVAPGIFGRYNFNGLVSGIDWNVNMLGVSLDINYSPFETVIIEETNFNIDTTDKLVPHFYKEKIVIGKEKRTTEISEDEDNYTEYHITTIFRTDTLYLPKKPPVITDSAPRPPTITRRLLADFNVTAYDKNNKEVKADSILLNVELTRDIYPLLPYIFFEEGKSNLPRRYNQLKQSGNFDESSLNPNPINYHRNNLNVIGKRMLENSNTKIRIQGFVDPTTEKDKCDLALSRSIEVQKYLNTVWGIPIDRLEIVTRNNCYPPSVTKSQTKEGYAENRRVEISSDNSELLFAVTNTYYQNPVAIAPTRILLEPKASIETTIDGIPDTSLANFWSIDVSQNDFNMLSHSSNGATADFPIEINRNNANKLRDGKIAIKYRTEGADDIYSKEIELTVKKDTAEYESQVLTLTLFQVSQTELDTKIKDEIRKFVKKLPYGAEIEIIGYSDNIGNYDDNKLLSLVRADEVRKFIQSISKKARIVKTEGVGSDLFPPGVNSYKSPEERFISRTVSIRIRNKR